MTMLAGNDHLPIRAFTATLSIMSERIQIDFRVCHGRPVIRGTRVLVSAVLGALGAGDSVETVLEDYPNITREDVQAALSFAGRLSDFEELPYEVVA